MPEEDFHLSSPARSQAHIGRDIIIAPEIESDGSPMEIFAAGFWQEFLRDTSARALRAAVEIIFIVVLFIVARIVLFRIIRRAIEVITARQAVDEVARARTLGGLLTSVTGYVLAFVAGFMILMALGVNVVPVITAAGILGLAVGFGAQKLVRDVMSGFFILLENQYVVGEYVTIGSSSGAVESIGMRTTRLRDDVGKLVIISNGDITQVTNHSRGAVQMSVDISVAPESDLDGVCSVLGEVGSAMLRERTDVLEPFACEGVAAMDAAKVTLRLTGRIQSAARDEIELDLRRRAREALLRNGISLAS
ncbi:MAG: mechanosensitive ion channel [Armatimonadetes bacterium]|nr:mechanosensitive ion channel [Armatimonadota bacterium]